MLSRVELERFCYLDDDDRRLIAARRRDYNRLGFAVQVVTVRYLGMFLSDPIDVPVELVAYLAEQLEIEDPSCLITEKLGKPGARWLDARRVDHDLIGGMWSRLVYVAGRPAETVDHAAYIFCVLEQFHRHLKHRNIFVEASSKWRDPRAHLLTGAHWEIAREAGLNALGLPPEPSAMLAEHAEALDTAYREVRSAAPGECDAAADRSAGAGAGSDVVFGLPHLLGRQYRPQLANLPDQRLWRIDPAADYGPLDKAARGRIDVERIGRHWADMCRIAVSIHTGEVSDMRSPA